MSDRRTKRLAGLALAAAIGVTISGCGSANDSAPSPPASKASTSKAPSKSTADKVTQRMKGLEKRISIKGMGFSCKWKSVTSSSDDGIGVIDACKRHEILLFVGPDHASAKVWADSMGDKFDTGSVLLGSDYAVMSPDQGTVNRVYDLLGAKGDVKPL